MQLATGNEMLLFCFEQHNMEKELMTMDAMEKDYSAPDLICCGTFAIWLAEP
jgi:hypothetical protein